MPSSSSFCAMISLSSTEKETASPCVPSRRVVSNVKIFIMHHAPECRKSGPRLLLRGQRRVLRYPRFLLLFKERHHLAQFAAHLFDLQVAPGLAHLEKLLPP